jgi:hypothetical protein
MGFSGSAIRKHATWAGVSLIFALAQFRMIMLVLGPGYANSIDAALGVVRGLPHWRAYQSRVLGPWMIEILSGAFGGFSAAHVFFTIAMTAVAGWLILALTQHSFGRRAAWGAFFLFHALFAFLLGKLWLYAWDHSGIVVFILFIHFVLSGKDWRWFTALFVLAVVNRESAFFIALWMVLDPLVKAQLDRTRPQWALLLAGLACLGFGLELVGWLRDALLVREVGPELFNMPAMAGKTFHNQWHNNLEFLGQVTTRFSLGFEILIPLFLGAVLALAALLAWRDRRRYLALALTQAGIVASLFVAAALPETRVMLELVPFLAMGIWAARAPSVAA